MRQKDLKFFRDLLASRREEILAEAGRAVGVMNGKAATSYADPSDRALLESDRGILLRMKDRERKLLVKITEAFERLDDGSYGTCEECSGVIGIERLKARPVTTLCISCKSSQEERERQGLAR